MAERHAQRHWLKLQAEKAVVRALELPDKTVVDEVIHITGQANISTFGIDPVVYLRHYFDVAIVDAAKALEKAELIHREIVRRGGKV